MYETVLYDFLKRVEEERLRVRNIRVLKDDEVIAQKDFTGVTRCNICSCSKSFTSIGVGVAIEEGYLGLDEKIAEIFPEHISNRSSENLKQSTVKNFLEMSSGLSSTLFTDNDEGRKTVKDWLTYFFQADFDYTPGASFRYSNFNSYVLSCAVEKRTGRTLADYMTPRVFEPLGIGNPCWIGCPMGHTVGYGTLLVTVDELAALGQMLLNQGSFGNRKIISKEYLSNAVRKHQDTTGFTGFSKLRDGKCRDFMYGYGLHYWMGRIPHSYYAAGLFGSYCIVLPDSNAVISIISDEDNDSRILTLAFDEIAGKL